MMGCPAIIESVAVYAATRRVVDLETQTESCSTCRLTAVKTDALQSRSNIRGDVQCEDSRHDLGVELLYRYSRP